MHHEVVHVGADVAQNHSEAVRGRTNAPLSTEFSGSCGPERRGRICRSDTGATRRFIGGFKGEGRKGSSRSFCRPRRGSARPGRTRSRGMLHRRDFCFGEKRGHQMGKTKRGKGTKIMAIVDGNGLPIAGRTESASPAEVNLVEDTLDCLWVPGHPNRLIGDKAYDSDPLDEELTKRYGTEMIAPNRRNRIRRTQDGRSLRRYKRRWKVERLFAWLHNFRRLVVQWEYHAENFTAFFHLGCAIILLRHL